MNILITNVHSVRNAGDAVLLEVTLSEIGSIFPEANITVSMNDPDDYRPWGREKVVGSFIQWFKSGVGKRGDWKIGHLLLAPYWLGRAILAALVFRWTGLPLFLPRNPERRRLLMAYFDADLIISCPGNFFLSGSGLGLPLFLAVFSLAYGWLVGKPLYMMQQSVGPLRRFIDRVVVTWLLRRLRIIFLRDSRSMETLRSLNFEHPRCFVIPDVAFLYQGDGDVGRFLEILQTTRGMQRPFIGVTVIDFGTQNRFFYRQKSYEKAIVDALSYFVRKHGGSIFVFPQVCGPSEAEDDRIPGQRIVEALIKKNVPAIWIDTPWRPNELQAAYGQMDMFVGTRLHSNIFAMTAGTPVIAIAYYYKTYGIMQMLELSEWVQDIQTVDSEKLANLLEELWKRHNAIRRHLGSRLPTIRAQAHSAVQFIQSDFRLLSR